MDDQYYQKALQNDPGDPLFAEYAERLRSTNRLNEALNVCLAGLSVVPSDRRGRLLLARIFYELKYIPFARRELEVLAAECKESKVLARLLSKFGLVTAIGVSEAAAGNQELTISEADFEISDLEE